MGANAPLKLSSQRKVRTGLVSSTIGCSGAPASHFQQAGTRTWHASYGVMTCRETHAKLKGS
eukprot:2178071-Amphidinium_carterae.1